MTAAQSSEDNDGHQFRATIGPRGSPPQGADQSGILSRFPEALAPRTSIVAVAGGSASGARVSFDISAAAPEAFRGLSEGFIDFEALVTAATGSRHCPNHRPSRPDPPPGRTARDCRWRRPATSGPNRHTSADRAARSVGRGPRHHSQRDDHRQLIHHARSVDLDRAQADPEIVSDQLVRPACQQPSRTSRSRGLRVVSRRMASAISWSSIDPSKADRSRKSVGPAFIARTAAAPGAGNSV